MTGPFHGSLSCVDVDKHGAEFGSDLLPHPEYGGHGVLAKRILFICKIETVDPLRYSWEAERRC